MQRVGNQTGKLLERFLHEMIALYACLFWGANFEEELKRRKLIDKSSTRSLKTTTVGTAYEIIKAIIRALKKDLSSRKSGSLWTADRTSCFPIRCMFRAAQNQSQQRLF